MKLGGQGSIPFEVTWTGSRNGVSGYSFRVARSSFQVKFGGKKINANVGDNDGKCWPDFFSCRAVCLSSFLMTG